MRKVLFVADASGRLLWIEAEVMNYEEGARWSWQIEQADADAHTSTRIISYYNGPKGWRNNTRGFLGWESAWK